MHVLKQQQGFHDPQQQHTLILWSKRSMCQRDSLVHLFYCCFLQAQWYSPDEPDTMVEPQQVSWPLLYASANNSRVLRAVLYLSAWPAGLQESAKLVGSASRFSGPVRLLCSLETAPRYAVLLQ
jgi:hypothetical protein